MLCEFLVYSKVTQLYIYIYAYFLYLLFIFKILLAVVGIGFLKLSCQRQPKLLARAESKKEAKHLKLYIIFRMGLWLGSGM